MSLLVLFYRMCQGAEEADAAVGADGVGERERVPVLVGVGGVVEFGVGF